MQCLTNKYNNMNKEVKISLKGKRVLIDIPDLSDKRTKLHVPDTAEDSYELELMKKLKVLTVFKAGEECAFIKEGMKVYLSPVSLHNKVPVGDDYKFLISEQEIVYVYED